MLTRITPPSVLPISLIEAKAIARLDDDTTDNAMVMGYVRAAVEWVEERLGRLLTTSTWRYTTARFPCWGETIRIPVAPVQSVDQIQYIDLAGNTQTLDPTVYVVSGIGDVARISLAPGQSWPSAQCHPEAITIDFTAGYGDSWNDVPEPIRAAIGETVRALYDGCSLSQADEMLAPYKVWAV
jgi:uncharacterized phiE125 gp8 family phage protein